MNIIKTLKEANRRRLTKRRSVAQALVAPMPIQVSLAGQVVTLHSTEVHLSGVGSRVFHHRPDSVGDLGVMKQIFDHKDYDLHHWPQGQQVIDLFALIQARGLTSLIMDLGANIGAAGVFFCERYKGAKLICVEPDPANCDLLSLNMRGLNHTLFRGAISSKPGKIALIDPGHGDWGFRTGGLTDQVNAKLEVDAETVSDLMEKWGQGCVPMVVKIDIEGAEADLFGGNCSWMDLFPCIVVELHDWMLPGQGTSRSFLKQVAARELDFVHRGENIFLFNPRLISQLQETFSAADGVTATGHF